MPTAIKRPCSHPGCMEYVTIGSRCDRHVTAVRKQVDIRRGSAASRGYDRHWQKARYQFLKAHPLCEECRKNGGITAASVVDHIDPHRGDKEKFSDQDNWQSLCKSCHDAKTAREDGRWGEGGQNL